MNLERESNLHNSRMLLCSVPRTPSQAPTIFEGITPILSHTGQRQETETSGAGLMKKWKQAAGNQPRKETVCMKLFCVGLRSRENWRYLHQTYCRYCSLYSSACRNSRYLDILDNLINTFNQLQSEQRPSNYRISGFIFNIYIDWIFNTKRIIG